MILFYRTSGPYGAFSNFSRHPVEIDGTVWPTSEHAFQAFKFDDDALREAIRKAPTPKEAARMGRDRSNPLRKDWDKPAGFSYSELMDDPGDGLPHEEHCLLRVKDALMFEICVRKFTQHPDLQALLKGTSGPIVEDTSNDYYWGWGTKRTGENKLGRILMVARNFV